MSATLLLVGHGSHLNAHSSEAVHAHALRLAEQGAYAEVRVAFWKEEPALSRALDGCGTSDVVVVPVFMSEGYFTNEVIPAELGLDGPGARRDAGTVRVTRPVGVHPSLADIVVRRALDAGACERHAVFVLGHGTPRNPASSRNVYAQVERVRATDRFAEVIAVFTDQDPNVAEIGTLTERDRITVVPFFAAEGWHVGETIRSQTARGDRTSGPADGRVRYTAPVGTHPAIAEVIEELAREAAN